MHYEPPTRAYVARPSAEGLSKREIIRCLEWFIAREIYRRLTTGDQPGAYPHRSLPAAP